MKRLIALVSLVWCGLCSAQMDDRGLFPERTTLENGVRVVLIELPGYNGVSVDAMYAVGAFDEPEGVVQATRLLGRMRDRAPCEGYAEGEAFGMLNEIGSSRTHGLPGHLRAGYTVLPQDLELALSIEASRLRGITLDGGLLAEAHEWSLTDVLDPLEAMPDRPLMPHALETAGQFWNHGIDAVRYRAAPTPDEVVKIQRLADEWLTPDRLTLVLFGGFDPDAALESIRKHFGSIEPGGEHSGFPQGRPPFAEMTWDADATVAVAAWDAPEDPVACATLVAWGTQLADRLTNDPELAPRFSGITASRLDYPAGRMPVVVYGRVRDGEDAEKAAKLLAERAEALVAEPKTRIQFNQLASMAKLFRGQYVTDTQSLERKARQLGSHNGLKRVDAQLRALEPFNDNFAFIELAFGPDTFGTCQLVGAETQERLLETLTSVYTPEHRSVVLIRKSED